MKMKVGSFYYLAVIFCLAILLPGCGGNKVGDQGKITVVIACTYNPIDIGCQIIDKSLDEFMKRNPDIKVKKIWLTEQYNAKLLTMIAGGNPPDIFRVSPDYIPTFAQKGILEPLDKYIAKSSVFKLDDFYPQVLYKYKYNTQHKTIGKGPIYGFGTDWSSDYTLFYNKDMFDKAGLSYPTGSMSWAEFRQTALKLTRVGDSGKEFGCRLVDVIPLIYQNGGSVFSPDGKKCLLNSPQAVEAFQYLVDLRIKDRVMPSASDMQAQNQLQLFQTGRLGMFLSGRHFVPIMQKQIKGLNWGVAPGIHQKKRINMVIGPFGWVMSSKTRHKEAAWKLMEHLVVGDGVKELARAGYNIPAVKKIAESDMFLSNPNHPAGINKVFMDEVKYTVPSPLTPYAPTDRWQGIIAGELELACLKKQTAQQAAWNATRKINELLAENIGNKQ